MITRALAKRPYFEARSDKRYFLARLAAEVRAGQLEVHAYCLLTTHFHLLVRSPVGALSDAMRRVLNAYSRFFNRRRRRDGPLVRARFFSKRVDTAGYWHNVVRYIDINPVRAGMVGTAAEHEFGSARAFVTGHGSPWLSRDLVARSALAVTGAETFDGATYLRAFGAQGPDEVSAIVEFVEARMASSSEVDPLDDLIGRTPKQVREWMARKALLADGMEIGLPVCGPSAVARALRRSVTDKGDWLIEQGGALLRGSEIAHIGLLRDTCSAPFTQIGSLLGLGVWAAKRRVELHRKLVTGDPGYAARVARIAHEAIEGTTAVRA